MTPRSPGIYGFPCFHPFISFSQHCVELWDKWGTADPFPVEFEDPDPQGCLRMDPGGLMASAQNARALATDKQEHVFIYLFILEYGATGRGRGTHALRRPCLTPLAAPPLCPSTSLREGNRPGRGRDRVAAAGRTPSSHGSSDEPSPENANPESPPGPEHHSLHAVPGRGMSASSWNTSHLRSHHAAICSPGVLVDLGPGGRPAPVQTSPWKTQVCSRNPGPGAADTPGYASPHLLTPW